MPDNPGGIVYGTILVATLLAAEAPRSETYARTIAAAIVILLVYWLATSYAYFTGERLRRGEHFTVGAFVASAVHELTILAGALGPLLALVICWAAGASLSTAVAVAVWAAAAMIVAVEVVIAVRAELRGRDLVAQTILGIILGLLVEALRVLLH